MTWEERRRAYAAQAARGGRPLTFDEEYERLAGRRSTSATPAPRGEAVSAAAKRTLADMQQWLDEQALNERIRQFTKELRRENDRLAFNLLHAKIGDQLRALQRASEDARTAGRFGSLALEAKAAVAAAARTGQHAEHKSATWAVDAPAPTIGTSGASTGSFEGYLAVFGSEDMIWANPTTNGDIIEPGAFTKTLAAAKGRKLAKGAPYLWPIFWEHDDKDPIGGFTDAAEDPYGLFVRGELDLDIEQGKRAYSGIKKGYCAGMSIGFFTIRATYDGQGRRHLKELSVFEGSLTSIPMHSDALVTSSN